MKNLTLSHFHTQVDRNFVKPSNSMCKKHVKNKHFQEEMKDWLCAIIERSATESHELDSMFKLKMHVDDIEK